MMVTPAKRPKADSDMRDDRDTDVVPSKQISLRTRELFGPPDKLRMTLRYIENNFTITSALGANGNYYFSCNSLFDPNRTGGGHQPLYFDQFAALYNHYTVNASECEVWFTNLAGAVVGNVCLAISDDTSGAASEAAFEQRHAISSQITPLSGSRSLVKLKNNWNSDALLGIDSSNDGSNKTPTGGNPSEESFYQLVFESATGGATDSVTCRAELHFDTIFSELTTPSNS